MHSKAWRVLGLRIKGWPVKIESILYKESVVRIFELAVKKRRKPIGKNFVLCRKDAAEDRKHPVWKWLFDRCKGFETTKNRQPKDSITITTNIFINSTLHICGRLHSLPSSTNAAFVEMALWRNGECLTSQHHNKDVFCCYRIRLKAHQRMPLATEWCWNAGGRTVLLSPFALSDCTLGHGADGTWGQTCEAFRKCNLSF